MLGLETVKNGKAPVEELSGVRLSQVLEAHKKGMIHAPAKLVSVKPNITWDATVTAVYPPDKESSDGHVDLDVHTERGFTLHYGAGKGTERVHIDHGVTKAHSCHPKSDAKNAGLKGPDGTVLSDKADLSVVAALNDKVAALLAQNAELQKKLADKLVEPKLAMVSNIAK